MLKWSWYFVWLVLAVAEYVLGMKIVRYLFVDEGSSVALHCTCTLSEKEVTWRGPNKFSTSLEKDEYDTIPYTVGSKLNPQLRSTNINNIRNNATEECILEITNFSRFDEGTYICENLKLEVHVFKVLRKKPLEVTVTYNLRNGTLNLQCSPSGVPNNYTFFQLEHISEFDEHIRFLNSSNDGSVLRTSIGDAGLEDTGIYNCKVSNGIPDKNGRTLKSGKTLVELEDAPIFLDGDIIRDAKVGETVDISAVVYNRHNVTKVEIQSEGNILKLKINITYVNLRKIFYGSNVTLNASLVVFQLDLMARKDFKIYFLELCNLYGCRDIKIDIRIDSSKISRDKESQHRDLESVFAAVAVLSVLGFGMTVAMLIRKRAKLKHFKSSQNEDSDEDTPRQSVAKELYMFAGFVNSDTPQHLLKATENEGYVYHARTSTSINKATCNNQGNTYFRQRFS